MEKKKSSNAATNYIAEIDEDKKDQIRKFFPAYFSEDIKDMEEEYEYFVSELTNLMSENKDDEKIQNYIIAKATILRNQCPFVSISKIYHNFLSQMKEKYPNLDYIEVPRYSMYFPNKHFPSLRKICDTLVEDEQTIPEILIRNLSNQELSDLLKDIFSFYHGRIPRSEQILLWYPNYLKHFFELQKSIMLEDGPLPLDWRYFLAIMSVSCYGCEYLYNLLVEGFIETGGDIAWLESSSNLPEKLKRLTETNYDLAYQPWVLLKEKPDQIASFLKGPNAWSRQELMQVLMIFSFYHSYCCYVYAIGILPEFDFPRDPVKDIYLRADDETWQTMMKDSPLMRSTNEGILDELNKLAEAEEATKDDKNKDTNTEKGDDSIDYGDDMSSEGPRNNAIFRKYFGDMTVKFDTILNRRKKIDSNSYEWKTNGYLLLEESFPAVAKCIDLKYDYINSLTLDCFGAVKDVKTDPFRKSIFYYIELIFGYEHHDFDYKKMNKLLHKDTKLAVKTMGTTPQNLSMSLMNQFPVEFKTYEICHIALLIMEAKFHIELMYGFLALQNAKG